MMAEWWPLVERVGVPTAMAIIAVVALVKGWVYTKRHMDDQKAETEFWRTRSQKYEDALTASLRKRLR